MTAEIRRLPGGDEEALRRYAAELWLPFYRELAATVDGFALADWSEERFVERNAAFTRERLAEAGNRGWVVAAAPERAAVDPAAADVTDPRLDLVGHVLTDVDECPDPFDRPDRLVIGEIYVTEPYRGTGLAERLVERAAADARDHGCTELRLDVDVDNERARAFYEAVGFEEHRERLTAAVDDL